MARSTAGYSGTPLVKKLGLKEGMTFLVVGAEGDYLKLLGGLPAGAKRVKSLREGMDFIHCFSRSEGDLRRAFPGFKSSLSTDGLLWISWPKGSSGVKTDLSENRIREIGLENGLVDV